LISNLGKAFLASTSACAGLIKLEKDLNPIYPPIKPRDLPPLEGYKIVGYMGCSESKIVAVQKKEKNLFFCTSYETPQSYALSRTSFWARFNGDNPVVLQIEIPIEKNIDDKELWRDPNLNRAVPSVVPIHISLYPAIPPEIQKRRELVLRVHHFVTIENKVVGGAICRAFYQQYIDFKNKFTKNF
jgi:hypothetical protein